MLEMAVGAYAVPMLQPLVTPLAASAVPVAVAAFPAIATVAGFSVAAAGTVYGIHRMVCYFRDPEPDREVDNDVAQRCSEAAGNYSRSENERDRGYVRDRPWSETGRDTLTCAEKLFEAGQMIGQKTPAGVAIGTSKLVEASESGARVVEDLAKDAAALGKCCREYEKEIDTRIRENGNTQYIGLLDPR